MVYSTISRSAADGNHSTHDTPYEGDVVEENHLTQGFTHCFI